MLLVSARVRASAASANRRAPRPSPCFLLTPMNTRKAPKNGEGEDDTVSGTTSEIGGGDAPAAIGVEYMVDGNLERSHVSAPGSRGRPGAAVVVTAGALHTPKVSADWTRRRLTRLLRAHFVHEPEPSRHEDCFKPLIFSLVCSWVSFGAPVFVFLLLPAAYDVGDRRPGGTGVAQP